MPSLHLSLSLPCATPAANGMATRASTISGTRILVSWPKFVAHWTAGPTGARSAPIPAWVM